MINRVTLVGHLGRDPEMRHTRDGTALCKFSMATTERGARDEAGERREHTEWHNITAWGKLAEICGQYLFKGTKVYVEGKMRNTKWIGKDGTEKAGLEIHIDVMEFMTPKGQNQGQSQYAHQATPPKPPASSGVSEPGPGTQAPPSAPQSANTPKPSPALPQKAEEIDLANGGDF